MALIKNNTIEMKTKYLPHIASILIVSFILIISVSDVLSQSKIEFKKTLTIKNFNYYIDTVFVAQKEQKIMGNHWVNKPKKAYKFFKRYSIAEGFQKHFDASFPKEEGKKPLVVRINKIHYSTFDKTRNFDFLLSISFLRQGNNNFYHLYTSNIAFIQKSAFSSNPESIYRHYETFNDALNQCFFDFLKNYDSTKKRKLNEKEVYDIDYILKEKIKLLRHKPFEKPVVFKTFDDFISKKMLVDTDLHLHPVEQKKVGFYYEPKTVGGYTPDSYFMIFDGSNYFIYYHGAYHKIEVTADNKVQFSFVSDSDLPTVVVSAIMSIGAAIGAGLIMQNNLDFGVVIHSIAGAFIGTAFYFFVSRIINSIKKVNNFELDLWSGNIYRVP